MSRSKNKAPYILGVGEDLLHLTQFLIVCEKEVMPYTLTTFRDAVVTLTACHYVFNIKYPTQTQSLCNFLAKFCLGINHCKKLSASAVGLISAIEKY